MSQPIPKTKILGVQLSLINLEDLLTFTGDRASRREKTVILSGNIHSFNLAYERRWLRDFMNEADIVRIDGEGLRIAAQFVAGIRSPARMTWADFAWKLAEYCERQTLKLFLLGAKPEIVEEAAAKLCEAYPNLQIAGTQHGYFAKERNHPENKSVLTKINESDADILIVGFGMPLQEKWLSENCSHLDIPVIFTGGAVFDYISGNLRRAPRWMTDNKLEWLGRLLIEPKRLWHRYVIGNPKFILRVLRQKFSSN